ncbi:glycosyltransferase family 4 protein [Rhizosaccharibacter radicis]|uniref:Glycosyltransferase family 4 protein n=1 Tax=Rhizosaccharibacter radicis TaxID=2782605 RepID=A0ABT1VZ01_9PROT|nr:glycosyltransferase family 4 protein [Acetobacteraceae bacterium KSS12]
MLTRSAARGLHRAWRMLPPVQRRLLLARGAALLAPRPASPPPAAYGVLVAGEIDRASGLGEGARLMAEALRTLGVPVGTIRAGLRAPGKRNDRAPAAEHTAAASPEAMREPGPDAALVMHVNAPQLPAALLALRNIHPGRRRLVGYWAWELPTLPRDWHPAAALVHEAWVPSRFTAEALRPLMPGRVRVVPHPLACVPPVRSALDRQAFGLPADAVVVLCSFSLASSFERKNPLAAIGAFRHAFGDRPDRIMLLKVSHVDHHPADLRRLREAIGGAPNVRLETRILPRPDAHALTAAADIVLSLHRSEGFGLVPAEAMLLGKPVVATDWSATTEFLDSGCGWPIGYRLVPAVDPRGVFQAPGAVWADASVPDAAIALRVLAEDAGRRKALGDAARARASERFGADALADALRGIGLPPLPAGA